MHPLRRRYLLIIGGRLLTPRLPSVNLLPFTRAVGLLGVQRGPRLGLEVRNAPPALLVRERESGGSGRSRKSIVAMLKAS